MGKQYKLHYFNTRGWAEPARIILSYGGADWEDVRYPSPPAAVGLPDDIKARAPYGQVPLLEFDGQLLSQSQAITRFLARQYNLVGSNDLEAARCDEIADAVKDFCTLWIGMYREQDETKKEELKKKASEDSKTRFLSKFNEILEANGGHFVGKGLTWADIYAAYFVDNIQQISQIPITEDFPAVQALIKTVYNTPSIKAWLEKRPVTVM